VKLKSTPQARSSAAQHVARRRGRVGGAQRAAAGHGLGALAVIHPHLAQRAHGRQVGEAIGAKTLHAAAFVVHADQQVIAHGLDAAGELQQLCAVFPVAGEQDHAAGQRVGQAAAVGGGELVPATSRMRGACSVIGLPIVKLLSNKQ
jgi:hypothetical protein